MLPSLFTLRDASVWFDYPDNIECSQRQHDRAHVYEAPATRKCARMVAQLEYNVNALNAIFTKNGFHRVEDHKLTANDRLCFNAYWGNPLPEEAASRLNEYQKALEANAWFCVTCVVVQRCVCVRANVLLCRMMLCDVSDVW